MTDTVPDRAGMAEYGLQETVQIASVASAVLGFGQCGDKLVDDHDGALRRLPASLCDGRRRQRVDRRADSTPIGALMC